MKLYNVPRKSIISLDGVQFKFYSIDGMYSYCKTMDGKVVHIHCCENVGVIDGFNKGDDDV